MPNIYRVDRYVATMLGQLLPRVRRTFAGYRHLVGDQRNLRCLSNVRPGLGVDERLPDDELSTLP